MARQTQVCTDNRILRIFQQSIQSIEINKSITPKNQSENDAIVVFVSIRESSAGITNRNCVLHFLSQILIRPNKLTLFVPRLMYTHPNTHDTPAANLLANVSGHMCIPSLDKTFRPQCPPFGALSHNTV
jgi:hypothetical protein